MMFRFFQMLAIAATLVCGANAQAQFGCDAGVNNCGREISQAAAAGLWAGYCTENCYDHGNNRLFGNRSRGNAGGFGCGSNAVSNGCNSGCGSVGSSCDSGCGLRSRLGNRGSVLGGGCDSGCNNSCGCDMGCFGYPTGGCGCGGSSLFGKFGSRQGRNSCDAGCGCGHSSLFANLGSRIGRDRCNNDCGCREGFLTRLLHHHGNRCHRSGRLRGMFTSSAQSCGSNGAYFNEAVGYEYGNAGMQSYVSGSGCDGNAVASPVAIQPAIPADAGITDAPGAPAN